MPSSRRGVLIWFVACGAILAAMLAGLGVLARSPVPVWRLVALAVGAHLPYVLLLLLAWRRAIPGGAWTVVATALVLRAVLVLAPPAFSDDVYRYVWDGRVAGAGYNPYERAPTDEALATLRNDEWSRINNPELQTIYPPAAQISFTGWAAVWPSSTGFKAMSAAADLGVICLVVLLAGGSLPLRRGPPGPVRGSRAVLAGALYGLNPIACIETGMSGHLEPLALLPTLAAVLLLARSEAEPASRITRCRVAAGWAAPVVFGLGCATKLVPALLWPVLGRRDWRFWVVTPAIVVAFYLPFASVGQDLFETTGIFVRAWEGNAGAFALLKAAAARIIGWIAGVEGGEEIVRIAWLDGPARALEGTFFTLHKDGGFDPAAPGAFTLNDLSLAAAKIAAGLSLVAVVAVCVKRRFDPVRGALWLFGALVLLSPVVHPWYLLWVLPFAALRGVWPWLALGAALPLAYLPLDGWWQRSEWVVAPWVPWVEHGAFFCVFVAWLAWRLRPGGRRAGDGNRTSFGRACG